MLRRLLLITAVALAALAPRAAQASSINFNCATCGSHNTSFDITYSLLNAAANTYQMTITATYQPVGAGTPDFTYLNVVAFKLSGVSYQNGTPSLVSGPAEDTWSLLAGGVNSSGCSGSGSGFFCASSTHFGATRGAAGSQDSWSFLLDLPGQTRLGSTLALDLKAQFTDAAGNKVGSLISDPGTAYECVNGVCGPNQPVPEPSSLLLLGSGLAFAASRFRRGARRA